LAIRSFEIAEMNFGDHSRSSENKSFDADIRFWNSIPATSIAPYQKYSDLLAENHTIFIFFVFKTPLLSVTLYRDFVQKSTV